MSQGQEYQDTKFPMPRKDGGPSAYRGVSPGSSQSEAMPRPLACPGFTVLLETTHGSWNCRQLPALHPEGVPADEKQDQ